jgi:hypothetical protein
MKQLLWSALFYLLLALSPAQARDFVLSDAETASRTDEWSISSIDLAIAADPPFSVKKNILHGGQQEGVELVEVDNGRMTVSVIPTRGMNVFRARSGDVTLGWISPVKQIVNPAYIELDSRGGLGWLDGFNEMLVRCGFEWAGHPGMDNGKLLTLHGRAGNTPAAKVVVVIDDQPPHRIHVRGRVDELKSRGTSPASSPEPVMPIIAALRGSSDVFRNCRQARHGPLRWTTPSYRQ